MLVYQKIIKNNYFDRIYTKISVHETRELSSLRVIIIAFF